MYQTDDNSGYIRVDYTSDRYVADVMNAKISVSSEIPRVQHLDSMGGYSYPILDWFLEQMGGGVYQILKCHRPTDALQEEMLSSILNDQNTLYSYPDGAKITVVQFSNWNNTVSTLADLGVDISVEQKLFKRIKTFNRRFRSHYSHNDSVRVCLIADDQHCSYSDFLTPEQKEMLLDGAFIISPSLVARCMQTFDQGVRVFDDNQVFETENFNRNVEVGNYYKNSKIFNARIFGDVKVINEGDPDEYAPFIGAVKGQAYTDHSGMCEYFGVDIIAPYSAFKKEVNISTRSFFLIEPQNAKLGQMFSDAQTIVNLPALYDWKIVKKSLAKFYKDSFERLKTNQMLEQWSDMSFAMFDPNKPKAFDSQDIATLTTWNVRAWLLCGGKLSDSPWLFNQMGKNFLASMRTNNERKMRFPVDCAVRALVITESLLRGLKGIRPEEDGAFEVKPGEARWDNDLSVLVVNDADYIEMYPSHGGCDLDDFFQIYWRTMDGERVIIVVRSPNDWGEYSIFKYREGDWHKKTYDIEFPEVSSDPSLWPKRLSEALKDGDIEYTGLPVVENFDGGEVYDTDYVLAAISATADSASSVGINVNARQLWSSTMQEHRQVQLCSMEDCVDAGVQGGSNEQVEAVTSEGSDIIQEILDSGKPIDAFLWHSKHAFFYMNENPTLTFTNVSYLQKVRLKGAEWFQQQYTDYARSIPFNSDYSQIHALGSYFVSKAISVLKWYRRSLYEQNNSQGFPDWDAMIDHILDSINEFEEGHARNSFVIALYSACLRTPLSSGEISDQFVMQPKLFPLLMEALQFYGVMGSLELIENTNSLTRTYITKWSEYDEESGHMLYFDDALSYQKNWINKTAKNDQLKKTTESA